MKKIFNKKDLAFWLGVILFICVLPIRYPIFDVEAAPWIEPSETATTDGNVIVTYNQTIGIDTKYSSVSVESGKDLTVNKTLWVTDKIENHGDISIAGGTLYVKNGIESDGDISISDGGIINSDTNISGKIMLYDGIVNGDITQNGGDLTITKGTVEGNITLNSGTVYISGAVTVNGNITATSGNVTVQNGGVVNGSVIAKNGMVYLGTDSFVSGDIINNSSQYVWVDDLASVGGNIKGKNITVEGTVNGQVIFCADESVNAPMTFSGKADSIVTNGWGQAWMAIISSASFDSIEIKPFDAYPVTIRGNLPIIPNTRFINHSGKSLLASVGSSDYYSIVSIGDGQEFSYNDDTIYNLFYIDENLGLLYNKEESNGTLTLKNSLPNELTYHIDKNSLYPFVLDASVQKGLSAEQYSRLEGAKDYSNIDVYSITIPAYSQKEIKVSVDENFADYGEVKRTASDVMLFLPNFNKDTAGVSPQIMTEAIYKTYEPSFSLSSKIADMSPKEEIEEKEEIKETKEIKDGSGSITVNDVYFGKTPKVNITSKTNDVSKATILFTGENYSSATAPTKPGTYKVTVTLPKNDNYKELVLTSNFKISYLPTPENPYSLKGNKGERNYYTQKVVITAPAGYTLSTSSDGQFTESIEISDSSESERLYLKNAEGEITDGIALEALLIDLKDPEIKNNSESESGSETAKIEISDENLYKIYVDSKEYSFNGTTAVIELKLEDGNGNQTFEIKAVDEAGRETVYTVELVSEWFKSGIIPKGGKLKIKKGQKFTLGDGVTGVEGDSTLYSSGVTFYTADEGEYIFK